MPGPLHTPQPDSPPQASLLGTTLMALLKKHIFEPFQLTLLNIGVTNFAGAKGGTSGKLCPSLPALPIPPCFAQSPLLFPSHPALPILPCFSHLTLLSRLTLLCPPHPALATLVFEASPCIRIKMSNLAADPSADSCLCSNFECVSGALY